MASSAAGIDIALLGQDGFQRAHAQLRLGQLRAVLVVVIVVVVSAMEGDSGELAVIVADRSPASKSSGGKSVFKPRSTRHFHASSASLAKLEELEVGRRDHAGLEQGIEVDDAGPVRTIEADDRDVRRLAGLRQGEDLEQLIQRAEAAGKDDQGGGAHREMHLPAKVVELEGQLGRE